MSKNIRIEKAREDDLPEILCLLKISDLPNADLSEHITSTFVAREGREIFGSAALELYGTYALLRSVAVAPEYRGTGLGERLTHAALEFGKASGITHFFLLTETAETYFSRFGFRTVDRSVIPAEVKESTQFKSVCPESALAMELCLAR